MKDVHNHYSLPGELEPDLSLVHAYWSGLKRGANDVPFWDDIKFSLRSRLGRESMLIDVFEDPLRFRFDLTGTDVTNWYGKAIGNSFLDEVDLHVPFDELASRNARRPSSAVLPLITVKQRSKRKMRGI